MDYIMLLSELHWFVHTETLPNVIVCCTAFGIRQIHSRPTNRTSNEGGSPLAQFYGLFPQKIRNGSSMLHR